MYSYQERWRERPCEVSATSLHGQGAKSGSVTAKIRESLYGINKRLSLIFEKGAFFYLNDI